MKTEKIAYRLENAIRQKWGQKGSWRQQIVMVLSYELGSLKAAWTLFKAYCFMIIDQQKKSDPFIKMNSDPGYYGKGMGNYCGD